MSDMVHEGNARILAATHEVNPAGCPVRDGHPRMHSECAICGQQPPARLEAARAVKAWGLGSQAWADRILRPDQNEDDWGDDAFTERDLYGAPSDDDLDMQYARDYYEREAALRPDPDQEKSES